MGFAPTWLRQVSINRVTGFTNDFHSFIVVEHIRFFHRVFKNCREVCHRSLRTSLPIQLFANLKSSYAAFSHGNLKVETLRQTATFLARPAEFMDLCFS